MTAAIIVAAGKGTRMGPERDKLFMELNGRPVLAHSWAVFDRAKAIEEIIVVCRAGLEKSLNEMARQYSFAKPFRAVPGGSERQDSVWAGLEALDPNTSIVAIHDGARPCVTEGLIAATIQAAQETGAAVAAQPVVDTIKQSKDGRIIDGHLERGKLWSVQTPQTFRLEVIRRALTAVRERELLLTDDTAACELIGQPVRLVMSQEPNPKVTVPGDLEVIAALLKQRGV